MYKAVPSTIANWDVLSDIETLLVNPVAKLPRTVYAPAPVILYKTAPATTYVKEPTTRQPLTGNVGRDVNKSKPGVPTKAASVLSPSLRISQKQFNLRWAVIALDMAAMPEPNNGIGVNLGI
jgi:hypothetical protein